MVFGYIVLRKKNGKDGPKFPVKSSLKIGRGTHCDLRIHVQSVSELHCSISVEKGKRALLQNLSATSQTLVNGVSIGKGTHALNHCDTINVGERSFQWHYAPQTPFFEGQKISPKKRRRSEADSVHGSQNVAVVNPLYHKRRTLGPTVPFSGTSRSPKMSLKTGTPVDPKKTAATPKSRTPASSKTPSARLSVGRNSTKVKTLKEKTPVIRASTARTPIFVSSAASSIAESPLENCPTMKSSVVPSPASRSPAVKSPASRSPAVKSPASRSPAVKSPASRSPAVKSPASRFPAVKSPAARSPAVKSPVVKSPTHGVSILKTPAKSPAVRSPLSKSLVSKTPAAKSARKSISILPKSGRKSKSSVKSVKSTKGVKRRLSSPAPVASKRFKIESPKSIDKKKMAVLMGIHGKSPRVMQSSTLSSVKVVLSAKKTPVIKAIKTPRPMTVKKSAVKSSVKKARRPLFSEILKKKAVQTANAVVKKLTLVPKAAPKPAVRKVPKSTMSLEIPQHFKFGSTGHANSPETIFISKKVSKTPVATKKGRKEPLFITHHKDNINLSGVNEVFKTPGKATSCQSRVSLSSGRSSTSSKTSSKSRKIVDSPVAISVQSPSSTPKIVLRLSQSPSSSSKFKTTSRPTTPQKTPVNEKPQSPGRSGSRRTPLAKPSSSPKANLSASASSEIFISRTPQSTSKTRSSKKPMSLLTSTPAVIGKGQSFAESVFESPSSLLAGQISAPQSPASGRKSRLEMSLPRSTYVHSSNASPFKSSLKASPSKSPPSGGHGKSLSVSFNDSIHVQMLVPGSRKNRSTTMAPLSSPASPGSEGASGTATPDLTTFDFNSIKTPNVPREMFVSSILSSGASSNSQASGSAKRKGKALKSQQNDVNQFHGLRRLLKTPTSPAGYVDVKGVKRLMTAACKTPTYLAVEGVKKLFGDAAVAAGNGLSSFAGVRELFASPSPSKSKAGGRLSLNKGTNMTPKKSSPVAKIQAEVESKGRSSLSTPNATRVSLPSKSQSKHEESNESLLSKDSQTRSSTRSSTTPVTATTRRTTRKKGIENSSQNQERASSPPHLPEDVSEGKVVPKRGRKAQHAKISPKVSVSNSPAVESPPKRKTRKTAKVFSPVQELPISRSRRGAKESSPAIVELPIRASKKAAQITKVPPVMEEKRATPVKSPAKSPVKATSKRTTTRKATVPKTPSPAKSPPVKRTTRREAKASTTASPPKTKTAKRVHSRSKESPESPSKKTKKETPVKLSPKKTSTRRTKSEVPPKPQNKRKAVTFDDDVITPQKKSKVSASKKASKVSASRKASSPASKNSPGPSDAVSPLANKRTMRTAASMKTQQPAKEASPSRQTKASKKTSSPVQAVSPRRTRSRK